MSNKPCRNDVTKENSHWSAEAANRQQVRFLFICLTHFIRPNWVENAWENLKESSEKSADHQ
jgi:hypothetical protein